MLYDKLPVIFLSALASEKGDAINSQIAAYVLSHAERVKGMGIRQLATECHVGIGTVSRFCREIGLESYAGLQQLLKDYHPTFERLEDGNGTALSQRIGVEMTLAAETVSAAELPEPGRRSHPISTGWCGLNPVRTSWDTPISCSWWPG